MILYHTTSEFRQKLSRKSKHKFCVQLIFPENRAFYEIMWKNIVQRTGHILQYNTAHALCMSDNSGKNTDTPEYSILIAFPLQQWLGESASMLRYMYEGGLISFAST